MQQNTNMSAVKSQDLHVIHQVLCNTSLTVLVCYMGKTSAEQYVFGQQTTNCRFKGSIVEVGCLHIIMTFQIIWNFSGLVQILFTALCGAIQLILYQATYCCESNLFMELLPSVRMRLVLVLQSFAAH